MTYGYARVASSHQAELADEALRCQEDWLRKAGAQVVVREIGPATRKLPKLEGMLARLQKGDTLIVQSMSRLSRDIKECLELLENLRERGIKVCLLKEGISNTSEFFMRYREIMMRLLQEASV